MEDSDALIRYAELVRYLPFGMEGLLEAPQPGEMVAKRGAPHLPIGILAEIHGEWCTLAVTRLHNPIAIDTDEPPTG